MLQWQAFYLQENNSDDKKVAFYKRENHLDYESNIRLLSENSCIKTEDSGECFSKNL